jgi:steroid delta-isomerase-like uncharacterized protein
VKSFKSSVVFVLLALTACGNGPEKAEAPAPGATAAQPAAMPAKPTRTASASDTLAILNDYLAAWNQHDIDGAGAFLADDVEYFDASFAGMQHGRQAAVEQGISVFMRGVPDLHWEIRSDPIVSNDGIAFEWTFTGTHTGTWGGIPATNQKINLKGMSFVRIKNGKIAYQAIFYDSGTLNRQLGI